MDVIADHQALEERLIHLEKMESVGRLAGGIAHDFNNLLTAILGYTELLLARHEHVDDPERRDLEEIQKAGQRAAALTQQLLAFSRKQVLAPKPVDVNETVNGLRGILGRLIREDISLTFDLSPRPCVLMIDSTQLEQVILNLVLNARDALPSGGCIRIDVAVVAGADAHVPPEIAEPAAEYVRLRVTDNGVGMAPEVRVHMFEPFFTTKDVGKGTGLGLASVYGIVRQSGGFIAFESEPGEGTTFVMHFPMAADHVPPAPPRPRPSAPEGSGTVMLVEDEDAVRAIVAAVLRRQGYRVIEAGGAHTACELFETHHHEVNLLITDVVMPEMNGPALAQRLIARRPSLRVLFISGYADLGTHPFAANNPSIGFLSKPFQASQLAARVREMMAPAHERAAQGE